MVTITKIIWEHISESLKINQLVFQGVNHPEDPVTKKDTENKIKAENEVIEGKEKNERHKISSDKEKICTEWGSYLTVQMINRNLLLSPIASIFNGVALGTNI